MGALKSIDLSSERASSRTRLDMKGDKSLDGQLLGPMRSDNAVAETSDSARDTQVLLYIDPFALTRDCVGHWLQSSFSTFELQVLADSEEIEGLDIALERYYEAIVNVGPEAIGSPKIAQTIAKLQDLLPAVPIAVLSHHEDSDSIRRAFDLRIAGYIPTSMSAQVAAGAVHLIGLGGTFAPMGAFLSEDAAQPKSTAGETIIDGFSQRQSQILLCLHRGMANKLIAYELNMCESTVKVHIRNIMRKLKATNRTEVAYLTRNAFKDGGKDVGVLVASAD